jgi:4-aminobutyrate aminotransferase-like enzyme
MSATPAPRRAHDFIPWAIQATQDNAVEIAGGEGVYFWDSRGKRYLDLLSQLFHLNLGHGNRRVIAAIQEQADRLCPASATVMHEGRTRSGQRLAEITPGNLCKACSATAAAKPTKSPSPWRGSTPGGRRCRPNTAPITARRRVCLCGQMKKAC